MLGLVLIPMLAFPTFLGIGIALFATKFFKIGNKTHLRWVWVVVLTAVFTFGSRLPDFLQDAIDTHQSVYNIREPITLAREATVGLVGGQEKFRFRRAYFDVSGLKSSGGSPSWGRPRLREYTALDVLKRKYDIQQLQDWENLDNQGSHPSYPIVKVQLDQTPTHDLIKIEVWQAGELRAQYAQHTRVWFRDELWANANDKHTLMFLMKATVWNIVARLYETDRAKQPSQFLEEAIVLSNTEPQPPPVYQPEIEERWLAAAPSSLQSGSGKPFDLGRHCTREDFPQSLKLRSSSLHAVVDDRKIKRWLPEPKKTGFSKAEFGQSPPGFRNWGISCGKDGYLILLESKRWERIEKLYHRLVLLDKDLRPIGVLNAELADYLPTQPGRIVDFRQHGDVVTVTSLLNNKEEPKRVHETSFKHSALTAEYATLAPPRATLEEQAAIKLQEALSKQRKAERDDARRQQVERDKERRKQIERDKARRKQLNSAKNSQKPRITPGSQRASSLILNSSRAGSPMEQIRIRRAQNLEHFPKAASSWKDRYPNDIYLPARGFMALYFNTKEPGKVIYREETDRVAISYSWGNFKGIPSQDLGALWYGRLVTAEPQDYELKMKTSHSDARISVDDRVLYKPGMSLLKRVSLPAGTHTILVEFANNWHTTDFEFDIRPVERPATQ